MFENKQETKQEHRQMDSHGESPKLEKEGASPAATGDSGDQGSNSHDALHGEKMPHRPDLVEQGRLEQKSPTEGKAEKQENSHQTLSSPEHNSKDAHG